MGLGAHVFVCFFFFGWWLAWGCGPVGKGALKVGVPGGRLVGGGKWGLKMEK